MSKIPTNHPQSFILRWQRWLSAILVLPMSCVTTWTFLLELSAHSRYSRLMESTALISFLVGSVLMLVWLSCGIFRAKLLWCYVFGHEMTHAILAKLSGGRVTRMHVSAQGGFIETNRCNWMVVLSPYFVPFWALIVTMVACIIQLVLGFSGVTHVIFCAMLGATWFFHGYWTLWMLPKEQPDLRIYGAFFSIVLIYFFNVVVLAVLLLCATPEPLKSAAKFTQTWWREASKLLELCGVL